MRPNDDLVIPEDLRFRCHMCGSCCRSFVITLDEGEAARIARHAWKREDPRFREGFLRRVSDGLGRVREELVARPDGACIFLDQDGLCLVEKRLGRAAKPRVCRQFPYGFVNAPDGVRVTVGVECVSRHRSVDDGELLSDARRELRGLRASLQPIRTRWRVQIAKDARFLEPAAYLELERSLQHALDGAASIADALRAMARVVEDARGERAGAAPAGEEAPAIPAALGPLVAEAVELAKAREDVALEAALRPLAADPARWALALGALDAEPSAAAFARVVIASGLREALPARTVTAEAGVGAIALAAILVGAAAAARAGSDGAQAAAAAEVNLAARDVSLLLRQHEESTRAAGLPDRCAPLCRALAI